MILCILVNFVFKYILVIKALKVFDRIEGFFFLLEISLEEEMCK